MGYTLQVEQITTISLYNNFFFFFFFDLISKVLFWVVVHRGNALCPVLLTWNYFILESSCGSGIVVEGALEFFGEIWLAVLSRSWWNSHSFPMHFYKLIVMQYIVNTAALIVQRGRLKMSVVCFICIYFAKSYVCILYSMLVASDVICSVIALILSLN